MQIYFLDLEYNLKRNSTKYLLQPQIETNNTYINNWLFFDKKSSQRLITRLLKRLIAAHRTN